MPLSQKFAPFEQLMRTEKLPNKLIKQFMRQYERYCEGETGKIPWETIDLPRMDDIAPIDRYMTPKNKQRGEQLMGRLACIKLNGGLGTSMALTCAKSLIPVRSGLSSLDLIAAQTIALRKTYDAKIPLLLMNSYRTRQDSLSALAKFPQPDGLPLDFLQHKVPRIDVQTKNPVEVATENDRWAPPGHGDVYLAFWLSGLLTQMIDAGYKWAFISNSDNLSAIPEPHILGFLADAGIDFAMEVTPKTLSDKKGGTLVRHRGRVTLLERAQVPTEHVTDFENIDTFSVFNTNNLWWRLDALAERMRSGGLRLPLIVNPKRVAERDVVQLETAMGAAVGCFERSIGIEVTRDRFAPVKATSDLLAIRSDSYLLDENSTLRPNFERDPNLGPLSVQLDPTYYRALPDFESRFPHTPKMMQCRSLAVHGDIVFGKDVRLIGDVVFENNTSEQIKVSDNTTFRNTTTAW